MTKSLFLLALCAAAGLLLTPALAQDKGPVKKAGENPKDAPKDPSRKNAGDEEGGGKPAKKDAPSCGRKPTAGDEPNTREHFRNFHDDGGDCHCACKHNQKKEGPVDPPPQKKIAPPDGDAPKKKDAPSCGRKPTAGDEPNTREHFRNFHDDGGDCHCACNHNQKKVGPVDPPPQKKIAPPDGAPPAPKKIGNPDDDAPRKKDGAASCGRKASDDDDEKTREHFKNVHKGGECHCACNHNQKKVGPVDPPPQKKIGPPDGAPPPVKKIGGPEDGAPRKKDGAASCGRKPSDADDAKTQNHFRNVHKGGECHCACDHVKEGGK